MDLNMTEMFKTGPDWNNLCIGNQKQGLDQTGNQHPDRSKPNRTAGQAGLGQTGPSFIKTHKNYCVIAKFRK